MIDKVKFMETLRSVAEVAKVAQEPLTREEIISYFDDIELNEEQLTMVYNYLQNPMLGQEEPTKEEEVKEETESEEDEFGGKIEDISDFEASEYHYHPKEKVKPVVKTEFEKSVDNSKFLAMYLEDLGDINTLANNEAQELYMRLIDGDISVMDRISDDWLSRVVELAKTYSANNVNYEDLIQEGNIGLISGMNQLLGLKKMIDVEEYLKESIQKAMEDYIDEIMETDDWEATIIAKTTLINEARKYLAEENVRIPTNKELADYTKIPEQEIEDILRLVKNND
ncbi:MAG: hypothetical protein PUC65_17320 [Clostridiales bacterium]|nr:hypothetical protein [Clostridiales bacterium]